MQKWINDHTPSRFKCILGGKVIGLGQEMSKQIDCMVVSDLAPRFETHERSICIVESLSMAISVKSTINGAELINSLENLLSIPQPSREVIAETSVLRHSNFFDENTKHIPILIIWGYIGIAPDTLRKHLLEWLQENPGVHENRLPAAIIINEKYIIQRTLNPGVLTNGTPIEAGKWKSSYIDHHPGLGLSHIINYLTNGVSLLNNRAIQFFPYLNEALVD